MIEDARSAGAEVLWGGTLKGPSSPYAVVERRGERVSPRRPSPRSSALCTATWEGSRVRSV